MHCFSLPLDNPRYAGRDVEMESGEPASERRRGRRRGAVTGWPSHVEGGVAAARVYSGLVCAQACLGSGQIRRSVERAAVHFGRGRGWGQREPGGTLAEPHARRLLLWRQHLALHRG